MKKTLFSLLAIALLLTAQITKADVGTTVDYLKNQSSNDWVVQGLTAADETEVDISFVDFETTDFMIAAKHLLTLSAVEYQNQSEIEDLLTVVKSGYQNGQLGSEELLNDDFWGLMALSSVSDQTYHNELKSFILSHQNDDGGWSWSVGEASDTNDTAAAIMALLETDMAASDQAMLDAIAYLQNAQREDGGFAYDASGQSDGASTSWVITALNKLNQDMSAWEKDGNSPMDFLSSLEQADGSYLWLSSDEQGSSFVTAYAIVAATGKSYPVNHIELAEENTNGVEVRIEGPDDTICLANEVVSGSAQEVLIEAASICNIDYEITDTAYGPYVSSIGGVAAEGMDGWQYWVNWEAGMMAASEYYVDDGDSLLWAYGGFPLYPTRLEVDKNMVAASEEFVATAQYHDGEAWQDLYNKYVQVGDQTLQTNDQGQLTISFDQDGSYPIYIKFQDEYIRSNKVYVTVGDGISRSVDLSVNINNNGVPGEDVVAFEVSRSSIDFGNLKPGQAAETDITLSNTGDVDVYIEASIVGNDVFQNYTNLNQGNWLDFHQEIYSSQSVPVNVGLSLPQSLSTSGQKEGQIIFWAVAR